MRHPVIGGVLGFLAGGAVAQIVVPVEPGLTERLSANTATKDDAQRLALGLLLSIVGAVIGYRMAK